MTGQSAGMDGGHSFHVQSYKSVEKVFKEGLGIFSVCFDRQIKVLSNGKMVSINVLP